MTEVTLLRHKKEPDDIIDVRLTHINRNQTHLMEINSLGHKRYVGFLATQGQFWPYHTVGETNFNSTDPKTYWQCPFKMDTQSHQHVFNKLNSSGLDHFVSHVSLRSWASEYPYHFCMSCLQPRHLLQTDLYWCQLALFWNTTIGKIGHKNFHHEALQKADSTQFGQ